MTPADEYAVASQEELWREIRSRHPGLREALAADARITAFYRGERHEFRSSLDLAGQILRLAWVSDAFLAQALYRAKARMQALGVPILPRLAHRLAMALAQISIGDPVVVHPGVYIVHGQVVADGLVEIHTGAMIFPLGHDRPAGGRREGRHHRARREHRHRGEGDRRCEDRRTCQGRRQRRGRKRRSARRDRGRRARPSGRVPTATLTQIYLVPCASSVRKGSNCRDEAVQA